MDEKEIIVEPESIIAGATDYEDLENKPSINNVELSGELTSADLGLQPAGNYLTEETDPVFSASASAGITNQDITNWNNKSDFSGSYNDLTDKPVIPDVTNFITKDVNNLTYYTLATNTGSTIEMTINSDTYVMTLNLKNASGTTISTQNVDLPLETMVIGGSYDNVNKKIILTLKNGNTIDVPVGDLINGLQSEITSSNKLDASLVDDSLSTNKFITSAEKSLINMLDNTGTGNEFLSDDGTYKTLAIDNDTEVFSIYMYRRLNSYQNFENAEQGFLQKIYNKCFDGKKVTVILSWENHSYEYNGVYEFSPDKSLFTGSYRFAHFSRLATELPKHSTNDNSAYFQGMEFDIIANADNEVYGINWSGYGSSIPFLTTSSNWGSDSSYLIPTRKSQPVSYGYLQDYVDDLVGDINTVLATLTTPSSNNGGNE